MSQSGQSSESNVPDDKGKMKKQLQELDLWEDGMTFEEMRKTLDIVKDSEKSANQFVQNITENWAPETPSLSQGTYSQILGSNSPATSERKSSSPEMMQRNKSLLSQEKQGMSPVEKFSASNKNSSNKSARGGQMTKFNKGHLGNLENSSEITNENKQKNCRQNSQLRQDDKIPTYKINPFHFSANLNDPPLVPYYRKFHNQDCNDGHGSGVSTTENVDRAISHLSNHLYRVAEIWHGQQRNSVETGFEWGSVIKVGDVNSSLDRRSNNDGEMKTIDETDESIETIADVAGESTRRRRACTANKSAIYDYGSEYNNSDDDFEIRPKRKKTGSKKLSISRTATVKSVEPIEINDSMEASVSKEKSPKVMAMCINVTGNVTVTDDETNDEPPKKLQRSKSAETTDSDYPRRIVPPKPKWSGVRSRRPLHGDQTSKSQLTRIKENDNENVESSCNIERNKSNAGLKDTEIAEELEKDDTDVNDDDDEVEGISVNDRAFVDVRPLRHSDRMKLQIKRLTQTREKEKTDEETRLEHERIKEDEIRRKKQERVAQRVRAEAEKAKREDEAKIKESERESGWRIFMSKNKRPAARTELFPDGVPRNSEASSAIEENHFGAESQNDAEMISDNDRGRETPIEHVFCPICNKAFTTSDIEAHAAACEEFEAASSSGESRSNSPAVSVMTVNPSRRGNPDKLECEICSNFRTTNGKLFEDHMTQCVERQRRGQNSSPSTIVEVSTSPIRTVRPISEQTDSAIDYKAQFQPKQKSNKNVGRKRKR